MVARWGVHLLVAGATAVTASCLVDSDDLLLDGPDAGGATAATTGVGDGALRGAKQLDASSGSIWLSDHRGVAVAFTVP